MYICTTEESVNKCRIFFENKNSLGLVFFYFFKNILLEFHITVYIIEN